MGRPNETSMGGLKSVFRTTHWSEIRKIKTWSRTRQKVIIDSLIRQYWKPVYCYLRLRGYDNERAKDLTQGFSHEIVLGKHLIERADETKGRFRTLLLRTLDHYRISVQRAETAGKRRPTEGVASLEDFDEASLPVASKGMQPDEAFAYFWASTLLDEVVAEVRQGCLQDNKQIHWDLFRARVLEPTVSGKVPPPLQELCKRFGINHETKASNIIVTVKRRFQRAISARVRQHVNSKEEVAQEIRDLMEILSRNSAS